MSRRRLSTALAVATVTLLGALGSLAPPAQASTAGSSVTTTSTTRGGPVRLSSAPPISSTIVESECYDGYLCVWADTDTAGSECAWNAADPDWRRGAERCSWSARKPIRSIYNRGYSSDYTGVRLYSGANYTGDSVCFPQYTFDMRFTMEVRSHRWVTGVCD